MLPQEIVIVLVDHVAREVALRRWALPECLHVPIAAVDEEAIRRHIGSIARVVVAGTPNKALLVHVPPAPPIDPRLPIFDLEASRIFFAPAQIWVHHSYKGYRYAYRKAFPDENITNRILSHAMNRRTAALKGYGYVRITPASRAANSSSSFSEQWAVDLHSNPVKVDRRGAFIQYADLADLLLLLDLNLGGGVMETVNEGQRLVTPQSKSEPV